MDVVSSAVMCTCSNMLTCKWMYGFVIVVVVAVVREDVRVSDELRSSPESFSFHVLRYPTYGLNGH